MSPPLAWLLSSASPEGRFADAHRTAAMAAALARHGMEPRVITAPDARPGGPPSPGLLHRVHPAAPPLRAAPPGWRTLGFLALAGPWLRRLAERERPAWIFTNSADYALIVDALKRRLDPPPLVHFDVMGLPSLEVEGLGSPARERLARAAYRWLEGRLLRGADLVTTVNARHADLVRARTAPRVRPVVVRDPADVGEPSTAGLPDAETGERALAVAFLGQLIRRRLDDLFWALERLPAALRLRVTIVGDGPDRAHYERRAVAAPALRERVRLVGYVDRPTALAHVVAAPVAVSDCWSAAGFPQKLFEYMALGRAIVVEGKPQIGEVLQEGVHCLTYRSPKALADALAALAGDAGLRRRLGAAARDLFETAHTPAHRRRQLDDLIAAHLDRVPGLDARAADGHAACDSSR